MRIDFPELSKSEHVVIRNLKRMSWGRKREIMEQMKDDSMFSQLNAAERITMMLITGGHILDENEMPINFPLNEQTVKDLPDCVVQRVVEEFSKYYGDNEVKKN